MNFKENADLLAQGVNFLQNACILSVGLDDSENLNMTTSFSGSNYNILKLVQQIINGYINYLDEQDRNITCNMLIDQLEELKK